MTIAMWESDGDNLMQAILVGDGARLGGVSGRFSDGRTLAWRIERLGIYDTPEEAARVVESSVAKVKP